MIERATAAPAALRLELLGGFRAVVDGRPIPDTAWRLRRARDLVALLALARGHRLHRDEVIDRLWPDDPLDSRLNGLHQVLFVARRALDEANPRRFLALQGELLSLTSGEPVSVDIAEVEAAAAAARAGSTPTGWAEVLEACSRELLPESRYEQWVAQPRRALEALAVEATEAVSSAGDGAAAGPRPADAVAEPTEDHNLPVYLSSFVGRRRDLDELAAILDRSRLLTLSGPGGAGKTRLACELARRVVGGFAGGAWLVDLGAVSDTSLVLTAIAEALAVRARPGDSLLGVVTARLRQRPTLLLLDNCEHLLGACAEYTETLLRDCSRLTVLATSREPLRVAGETVWRTPSLSLPAVDAAALGLASAEAVRLLLDRATAVDPGFAIDDHNAEDVVSLCRRLDGLPLAIELAAARLASLTPRQLLQRLDERFRLLTAGSRTALTRQQTLAATLDWSHDLLDQRQRAVLRRLSVFAGGFELEAAEAVCAGAPVSKEEVAAVAAELTEKSLIAVESLAGGRRHRLLETIREYARGKLAEAGELEETGGRHVAWYTALAERARPLLSSLEEPAWLERLEREGDNLRVALRWALDHDDELLGRLAAALERYWLRRLKLAEGIRWLDAAIEAVAEPAQLRARLIVARAELDVRRLGRAELVGAIEESARLAAAQDDHLLEGTALLVVGSHQLVFAPRNAEPSFRRALAVGLRHGLDVLVAAATGGLGVAAANIGDDAAADAHLTEALALLRRIEGEPGGAARRIPDIVTIGEVVGPRWEVGGRVRNALEETVVPFRERSPREAIAHILAVLGVHARLRGDVELAALRLGAAHREFSDLGDERGVAEVLARQGNLALSTGNLAGARACFESALRRRRSRGDPRSTGLMVVALGSVALAEGDAERAQRLGESACAFFTRAADRPGYFAALCQRADVALMTGDFEVAEKHYDEVGRYQPRMRAWSDFYLADVAQARGDSADALRLLESAQAGMQGQGRRSLEVCAARISEIRGR